MSFFCRNNVDISYELRGNAGPVVTFINGHTRTTSDYEALSQGLVSAGFRALLFDNRGSGKTKSDLKFNCDDLIGDVAALWQHLGIRRSHLIGFSMGGYLAQAVTISYPDNIDHLVLLSTSPGDHHVNHGNDSWITDSGTGLEEKLHSFFSKNFTTRNPEYMQKMLELTRKAIADGRFTERAEAQKAALFQFPVLERLHEIKCPTLLMHGRSDQSVFPAAATELRTHIRSSKLIWLDDTAHFSLIERPNEVLRAILDFLPGPNTSKAPI